MSGTPSGSVPISASYACTGVCQEATVSFEHYDLIALTPSGWNRQGRCSAACIAVLSTPVWVSQYMLCLSPLICSLRRLLCNLMVCFFCCAVPWHLWHGCCCYTHALGILSVSWPAIYAYYPALAFNNPQRATTPLHDNPIWCYCCTIFDLSGVLISAV